MYFFYICSLTNDCKKMKKKIMNVCGVALLAVVYWLVPVRRKEQKLLSAFQTQCKWLMKRCRHKLIVQDILSE